MPSDPAAEPGLHIRLLALAEALASRLRPPATIFSPLYRRSAAGRWRSRRELDAYRASLPPRAVRTQAARPVRLAYVLHNSAPYSSNGYAVRSAGVAQALQDHGLDPICITRPGFPADQVPGTAPSAGVDHAEGLAYQRIPGPGLLHITLNGYVRRSAEALAPLLLQHGATHVLAATSAASNGLAALIAARRLGLPFFYEARGFWELTRASSDAAFAASFQFRFLSALEQLVSREADHVFTLTGPMKDELVSRGIADARVSLVPNACDLARFTPRPRDAGLAAELGIAAETPVIGYIGSFVDYEGLDDLIGAAALLKARGRDFRLLLVGSEAASSRNPGSLTAGLRAAVARHDLASQVIMPGRVPHGLVERYYSLVDVAPFPRKPWPVCEMVSPLKPLEAMAMEKTVLVSSVQAQAEMVRHGETGWIFEKGRLDSLADSLATLLGDAALRQRLGAAARQWAAQERTWRRATAAMADIIGNSP